MVKVEFRPDFVMRTKFEIASNFMKKCPFTESATSPHKRNS